MQLKRDTDYTLRILLCLHKHENAGHPPYMTVYEISKKSGIPVTVCDRLCKKMAGCGLIDGNGTRGKENGYMIYNETSHISMLEIIRIVEGETNIFAVFDKSIKLYKSCGFEFDTMEQQIKEILNGVTINSLISL